LGRWNVINLPGAILEAEIAEKLSTMNDSNKSFVEIADEIERLDKAGEIEVNIP